MPEKRRRLETNRMAIITTVLKDHDEKDPKKDNGILGKLLTDMDDDILDIIRKVEKSMLDGGFFLVLQPDSTSGNTPDEKCDCASWPGWTDAVPFEDDRDYTDDDNDSECYCPHCKKEREQEKAEKLNMAKPYTPRFLTSFYEEDDVPMKIIDIMDPKGVVDDRPGITLRLSAGNTCVDPDAQITMPKKLTVQSLKTKILELYAVLTEIEYGIVASRREISEYWLELERATLEATMDFIYEYRNKDKKKEI